MSCGVGCRCGLDPALLWYRLAAIVPIRPLAWEPPYASGVALEKTKKKRKRKTMVTKGDRWGSGRDGLGVWDWHMHTKAYGMTGQWGPAVQHRELYPINIL